MSADAASLWQRAVTASARGRPVTAVRLLERALSAEEWPDPDLRGRVLISLANARSEVDGVVAGLGVLDQVADPDDPEWAHRGLWHGQRGLLLLRAGRLDEADEHLGRAAQLLGPDEPAELVRVLMNRGVLAIRRGQLDRAEADFRRSLTVAQEAGQTVQAAKATGNLAYLAYVNGDVPRALRLIDEAAVVLSAQSRTLGAVAAVDRSHSLVAAGLLREASETLHDAAQLLGRAGLRQDQAEAELAAGEVARLQGDPSGARRLTQRAMTRFEERGATGWSLLAQLELARLDVAGPPAAATAAAMTAAQLRPRLDALGLTEEAQVAHLLQISGLLAGGDVESALVVAGRDAWTVTRSRSGARIATRMLAHETRAALVQASAGSAEAQRVRERGLRDLATWQSRLGSLDLLTSATSIGARLARDGLAEALKEGRVPGVYAWSERVRATSARIVPVRPPADPEASALLARLRQVRAAEREQRLGGQAIDPHLAHESRRLEQEVRQRKWRQVGREQIIEPVGLDAVRAQLGSDGTLVSLMAVGDRVHALTLTGKRAHVRPVGTVAAMREAVFRVRADLDVLAGQVLPSALRAAVNGSLRAGLEALAPLAATEVRGDDLGGPVVVVPAGLTAQVPWTLLPSLRGRPVCVVPSATWWVNARTRSDDSDGTEREVFVAGPDVTRAVSEVTTCAQGAREGRVVVLTGASATAEATLAAMDGAAVLHVAAHGRHEPDNPLFSSLGLADGWLFGHDLDAVGTLPRQVVLSACETGVASMRPGDEALGMTAAFLHGGCLTVVGSVARVGDAAAECVAVEHHRGLRAGRPPASALADALEALARADGDDVAPTVCFGLGW